MTLSFVERYAVAASVVAFAPVLLAASGATMLWGRAAMRWDARTRRWVGPTWAPLAFWVGLLGVVFVVACLIGGLSVMVDV